MSKQIFISCVHEDSHQINNIKDWAAKNRLGNVVITHETEDNRPKGKEAVKQHLEKKIEGASAIFVLIGNDTHNHEWIEAEVELAKKFNKEIICARIPQTTGAIPSVLDKNKPINFDPDSLRKILESK